MNKDIAAHSADCTLRVRSFFFDDLDYSQTALFQWIKHIKCIFEFFYFCWSISRELGHPIFFSWFQSLVVFNWIENSIGSHFYSRMGSTGQKLTWWVDNQNWIPGQFCHTNRQTCAWCVPPHIDICCTVCLSNEKTWRWNGLHKCLLQISLSAVFFGLGRCIWRGQ